MTDDGVVGIALHGLIEATQNLVGVILAVLVAASSLLGELVEPAGLEQITQLDPLIHVTIVPEVTLGKGGLGRIESLSTLEQRDTLIDVGNTLHEDFTTGIVLGERALLFYSEVRHFTVEVGHQHHTISTDDAGNTCILTVLVFHCLLVQVRHITVSTNEPPLVGSGCQTILGVPERKLVLSTSVAGGTCPVTTSEVRTPCSELVTAIGEE